VLINEVPKVVPLRYGELYCETCRETLRAGMQVAWWRVPARRGGVRKAVLCRACHNDRTVNYARAKKQRRKGGR
jgi:RNase P subunit RPR2